VVLEKAQGEVLLHQGAVDLGGPVPAKLIPGFEHRKARLANAVLGGAVAPPVGFAFDQLAEILDVGALLVSGLLGQLALVLGDKAELQVREMTL